MFGDVTACEVVCPNWPVTWRRNVRLSSSFFSSIGKRLEHLGQDFSIYQLTSSVLEMEKTENFRLKYVISRLIFGDTSLKISIVYVRVQPRRRSNRELTGQIANWLTSQSNRDLSSQFAIWLGRQSIRDLTRSWRRSNRELTTKQIQSNPETQLQLCNGGLWSNKSLLL